MNASVVIGSVLLDKYRVERILGQGGMGYVVAVRHIDLGQLHAMKFLLPDAVGHAESVERFLREAQAAAALRSHHVVRVHDVGRMPGGAPYMVMEYLEGCDLKKYLERQGPLPVDEALRFVLHACDAIAEAHLRGIIHRDLKPANLFLTQQRDGDPIVKVVDFGISKHTSGDKPELTDTNATLGSPLYMSPEQIAKSKTVDAGTDIWALGLIAYELLTGISPFRASSILEVAAKVLQEEPRPLREVRPDVPEELASAITRCFRKKRKERWLSIEEFTSVLTKFAPQMSAARLSLPSLSNELSIERPAEMRPPTIAEKLVKTSDDLSSMLRVGEHTELTLGTTSNQNLQRAMGASRRTVIVTWLGIGGAMVALGGVFFLACEPIEPTRAYSPKEIAPPPPDVPQPIPSHSDKPNPPPDPTISATSPAPSPPPSAAPPTPSNSAPVKQPRKRTPH